VPAEPRRAIALPGARPHKPALPPVRRYEGGTSLIADADLRPGFCPEARIYCDACDGARLASGSVQHGRYVLCNGCDAEYACAQIKQGSTSPGRYVRDKRFGEDESYRLRDAET